MNKAFVSILCIFLRHTHAAVNDWATQCMYFLEEGYYNGTYSGDTLTTAYYTPNGMCNYLGYYPQGWSYTCVSNETTGEEAVWFQYWNNNECSGSADYEMYYSMYDYEFNCADTTTDCTLELDIYYNTDNTSLSCSPWVNHTSKYYMVNGACNPQIECDMYSCVYEQHFQYQCSPDNDSYVIQTFYSESDYNCDYPYVSFQLSDLQCPMFEEDEYAPYAVELVSCAGTPIYSTEPITTQQREYECSWLLFGGHLPMTMGQGVCLTFSPWESMRPYCKNGEVWIERFDGNGDCDEDAQDTIIQKFEYWLNFGYLGADEFNCDGMSSACADYEHSYYRLEFNDSAAGMDAYDICTDTLMTDVMNGSGVYGSEYPVLMDFCYPCNNGSYCMVTGCDEGLINTMYNDSECTNSLGYSWNYKDGVNMTYGECDWVCCDNGYACDPDYPSTPPSSTTTMMPNYTTTMMSSTPMAYTTPMEYTTSSVAVSTSVTDTLRGKVKKIVIFILVIVLEQEPTDDEIIAIVDAIIAAITGNYDGRRRMLSDESFTYTASYDATDGSLTVDLKATVGPNVADELEDYGESPAFTSDAANQITDGTDFSVNADDITAETEVDKYTGYSTTEDTGDNAIMNSVFYAVLAVMFAVFVN